MAKCGPWMKYVNAFMMPNSKLFLLLAALGIPVQRLLYKGLPDDVNPSARLPPRHTSSVNPCRGPP